MYFSNFPLTKYRFGDNEPPVYFQKLTVYLDLLEQIKQETAFYSKVTIMDNERPDTLSYRLYGTTDYYWTFYMMNDKLRESGWPLSYQRLYDFSREVYPNWSYTTEDIASLAPNFPIGQVVTHTSGLTSTVVSKNLDLGQIIVEPIQGEYTNAQVRLLVLDTTSLSYTDESNVVQTIGNLSRIVNEYDSIHHYENADGDIVDIDPFAQGTQDPNNNSTTGLIPITNFERLENKNQDLQEIVVLRPSVVNRVAGEFQRLLKQ